MCRDFASGEFAESGRCLGYNGSAVENILEYTKDTDGDGIKDVDLNRDGFVDIDDITPANIISLIGSIEEDDIIVEPWEDNYNSTEINWIENATDTAMSHILRDIGGGYWIASRYFSGSIEDDYSSFGVQSSYEVQNRSYNSFLYGGYNSDWGFAHAMSRGVRPVIVLESGLKVVGGDGLTPDSAYVLSY